MNYGFIKERKVGKYLAHYKDSFLSKEDIGLRTSEPID